MPELFVTCDDCGLSRGVNLATIELQKKGMATSASVLANFPAAEHALEAFAGQTSLSVGVHLNLTDGFSLTKPEGHPELTDENGRLTPWQKLFPRLLIPTRSLLELAEEELAAQIEFVLRRGVRPHHLTTHLDFCAFPDLQRMVTRLARRYEVRWIRTHSIRGTVVPFNPFVGKKPSGASLRTGVPISSPAYVVGLRYWLRRDPAALLAEIERLSGVVELVIHPCTPEDKTYPAEVRYGPEDRFREVRYLERFYKLLRSRGLDSIRIVEPYRGPGVWHPGGDRCDGPV